MDSKPINYSCPDRSRTYSPRTNPDNYRDLCVAITPQGNLVGWAGFEPACSSIQMRRDKPDSSTSRYTNLRFGRRDRTSTKWLKTICPAFRPSQSAPGRIRTYNPIKDMVSKTIAFTNFATRAFYLSPEPYYSGASYCLFNERTIKIWFPFFFWCTKIQTALRSVFA